MLTRPVLRYHGGKWMLAPWIISHFPKHKVYVEPYGGAASVLLRKPRSYAEVYNDLYSHIVNVFKVLQDETKAKELKRRIYYTPFAREEYQRINEEAINSAHDDIEKARLIIFKSFAGFGSGAAMAHYKTGFRANANRSGTTPAHDWVNYPGLIKHFAERLRGVVIESRPAIQVITHQDSPHTLHYVDPPYTKDTRTANGDVYEYEMTDDQHQELAETLNSVKGMVVLSGYNSPLYQKLYPNWELITKQTYADGASERTECLWLNPACTKQQKQMKLFK